MRAASMVFCGKRASRSTSSASEAAAAVTAAILCGKELRSGMNCSLVFSALASPPGLLNVHGLSHRTPII